jgi:hypothetical protein
MKKKIIALQKVALDCLSYHATANDEDAIWLSKETIPQVGGDLPRVGRDYTSGRCRLYLR